MSEPCTLRVRPDFNYTPQEWVTVATEPGYAGFVLLMPGRTENDKSVLKRVAEVRGTDRQATLRYKPQGDGMKVIDLPEGVGDVRQAIEDMLAAFPDNGLDPKPPVIK